MQDSCIGTHMAMWFTAFLPITYIWYFSSCYPFANFPLPCCPFLAHPQQTPVCDVPLPVSMCSHYSASIYEWEHVVFDFLFLCQFAENDGFQIHPCPYKGHKLIVFDGCIIFHGVYVPHFSCPVTFGLIPGLCYCKQCCNEHLCTCVLIVERFTDFWIYTQ